MIPFIYLTLFNLSCITCADDVIIQFYFPPGRQEEEEDKAEAEETWRLETCPKDPKGMIILVVHEVMGDGDAVTVMVMVMMMVTMMMRRKKDEEGDEDKDDDDDGDDDDGDGDGDGGRDGDGDGDVDGDGGCDRQFQYEESSIWWFQFFNRVFITPLKHKIAIN